VKGRRIIETNRLVRGGRDQQDGEVVKEGQGQHGIKKLK